MGSAVVNIPIIDLSTYFEDEEGKRKVTEELKQACSQLGLCQLINHGIPINLINQAMELSKQFFDLPFEEKLKFYTETEGPYRLPHGYKKHKTLKNEGLFMYTPATNDNLIPTNPPKLRFALEEVFTKFTEICQLLEGVLNDSLGLPPNLLQDYNNDRSVDGFYTYHYFPASETETNGAAAHQDANFLGLIYEDEIGGLEVLKDGEWLPVDPIKGAIVFHISDVLQVLTNEKLVSPVHQVVMRPKGKDRYSFAYFYNVNGEKWMEPLPQFTTEIGELPKYRKFQYKEYFIPRVIDKFISRPTRTEDKMKLSNFRLSD